MGNFHRVQWIDSQIRGNRYPNATALAEEFCISVRQAARDFEYLKYSLGAPMEYSAGKRGYYYTEDKFILPGVFLGDEEKAALEFLADRYRSSGGEMTDKLAALFDRISRGTQAPADVPSDAAAGQSGFPVFGLSKNTAAVGTTIFDAIQTKKKLRIVYRDSTGKESDRVVRPLVIHGKEDAQYLHAFCELRGEERDFRLERIRRAEKLADSFEVPQDFDPKVYGLDARFNFRLPYTASVEIGGEGIQVIKFHNSRELFTQLLSRGVAFTIVSPDWVREKFRRFLAGHMERNG